MSTRFATENKNYPFCILDTENGDKYMLMIPEGARSLLTLLNTLEEAVNEANLFINKQNNEIETLDIKLKQFRRRLLRTRREKRP